jgi:S-adenosylmethionine:tRNA ribosyltransferase-isomerase
MLHLSEFDYFLPKNLIASRPHEPRDRCKLLVYNRTPTFSPYFAKGETGGVRGGIIHTRFDKILNFLNPGDVLVSNDTKVIPARLIGHRIDEQGKLGRKFKVLLLFPPLKVRGGKGELWKVLIDGKKRNVGIKINFGSGLVGEISKWKGKGFWEMKFNKKGGEFQKLLFKIGKMPLPPYIKQAKDLGRENKKWYQTVYAKYAGSVAAPTAGLHFTKKLLKKLNQKGVQLEYITLHVGLGTFMPVKIEDIAKHKMHPEYVEISAKTAAALNKAKGEGRRIVAVGTTTTRALEAVAKNDKIKPFKGEINIFIYPPYNFKFTDALLTNFHLPKSTLLMLISALIGQNLSPKKSIEVVKKIYNEAINKKYRFYSYGDAMLII